MYPCALAGLPFQQGPDGQAGRINEIDRAAAGEDAMASSFPGHHRLRMAGLYFPADGF
jgi:hypothetical protein